MKAKPRRKPKPETVLVNLRLPKHLVNTLAAIAVSEERPLSVTMRRGIQHFVDEWFKQFKPAKE